MRNQIQNACNRNDEERISQEECRIILGSYGDQRLYYPVMTFTGFVILVVWGHWADRKKSARIIAAT
jgi:hypothetical protein